MIILRLQIAFLMTYTPPAVTLLERTFPDSSLPYVKATVKIQVRAAHSPNSLTVRSKWSMKELQIPEKAPTCRRVQVCVVCGSISLLLQILL